MYTALPKSGSPFGPAAARPGLHIWRVEKLQPVEVPKATWGVFFSGDAYLVLHNWPDERAHLHLWLGRDSSRDEQGACALLSTQLNALLGERPVTHREVQGNESDVFMEYFPRGITYQEGGVDSAFKPTRPGAGAGPVRKLYQVKGKKNIRASERGLSWASFNTGDCFILDLGETLFVWCGAKCNVLERSRAQELAAAIRDGERGGKARLEIVADGEEPPEMLQVRRGPDVPSAGPQAHLAGGQPRGGRLGRSEERGGSHPLQGVGRNGAHGPDPGGREQPLQPEPALLRRLLRAGQRRRREGLRLERAQGQRAGAPGGPESGRGGHRPHGPLAPDTGGNPARGPRDAPLQAVLHQLEVRERVPAGPAPGPGRHQACAGCASSLPTPAPCSAVP